MSTLLARDEKTNASLNVFTGVLEVAARTVLGGGWACLVFFWLGLIWAVRNLNSAVVHANEVHGTDRTKRWTRRSVYSSDRQVEEGASQGIEMNASGKNQQVQGNGADDEGRNKIAATLGWYWMREKLTATQDQKISNAPANDAPASSSTLFASNPWEEQKVNSPSSTTE